MQTKHSDIVLSVDQIRALSFAPLLADLLSGHGMTLDVAIVATDSDPTNDPDSPVWGEEYPDRRRGGVLALRSRCGTVAITISASGQVTWCGEPKSPTIPAYLDSLFFDGSKAKFVTGLNYKLESDGGDVVVSGDVGDPDGGDVVVSGRVGLDGRFDAELKEWLTRFPSDVADDLTSGIEADAALARQVLRSGWKLSLSPAY